MIRNRSFDASLDLGGLEAALVELDGTHRALVGIGNHAGETIGKYDTERSGNRRIVLISGDPVAGHPDAVIGTGLVYIEGELATVTAYRGD